MDFTMWVGKWCYDWEGAKGLWNDNDAWFGDQVLDGFYFTKPFSMGDFSFYVTHQEGTAGTFATKTYATDATPTDDYFLDLGETIVIDGTSKDLYATYNDGDAEYFRFGADANFNIAENFRVGLGGLLFDSEAENADKAMYEADFTFNFTPEVAFKGIYMMEDFDVAADSDVDDSPSGFRAIVDVSQDAFGFTSVWLEYASVDDSFYLYDFAGCAADGNGPYDSYVGFSVTPGLDKDFQEAETDVLFVKLNQNWTDQWSTFQRYVDSSADGTGDAAGASLDVTEYTFGVKYYYTPNLSFELLYDSVEYDLTGDEFSAEADDSLVRLRTHLKF